jgi:RNA polymerase sigma-70 factor (ECF subfamily)
LSVEDEQVVRALYDEHSIAVFALVRRLLNGDADRAQDIVQETMLRAWQHPEALQPDRPEGAHVRAWLFTVARRLVIDGQRARRSRPAEVSDLTVDVPTGNAEFERVLTAFEVADALGGLSRDHQAIIRELYFQDHSVAQAAVALGIPEGTVKSRAYYALRALRVACDERGIGP